MEKEFYHNDFEDLIKEKADQYKMYPSDKVWKNINSSLRSRKKWYWAAFIVLLSGTSYVSVTELLKPASARPPARIQASPTASKTVTAQELIPFSSSAISKDISEGLDDTVLSNILIGDSGTITAAFDIPLQLIDPTTSGKQPARGSLLIEGLEPLKKNEVYKIEVSLPAGKAFGTPAESVAAAPARKIFTGTVEKSKDLPGDEPAAKLPASHPRRISWQLAFSPTINYRKLTGGDNAKLGSSPRNVPLALQINGNINALVQHTPALGFELGTHTFLSVSDRITLKAGIQFNYSKYDIRAYRSARELATISLSPSAGRSLNSLTSYTDIRNFGGSSVDDIKNQYFQFSLPIGLELKVLGNDKLQFNIAGTIQPTYLLNRNSYLITTDYKNYTKAPSLVRRWNMNAGAEAYLSYNTGTVKWQMGPQFRYQLFSSYDKAYPIKEYLMEYGIKIGITKTIR